MGHRIHIHRPVAMVKGRGRMPASIARRAVDLAHDGKTPPADATEHLLRLARGRRAALLDALDLLRDADAPNADVECAQLLVRAAIDSIDSSRT
jgi:hypothetical protein